jgi:hydroxypyruvate reductase
MDDLSARAFLRRLFDAAIAAADPAKLVQRHLPVKPRGRTIVVGAGKASAAMAHAFEQHWTGELSGLVVTRYGHGAPCKRIEVVEAAHPVPDARGEQAAHRILELVRGLTEVDLVVALISGGGSALLSAPAEGLSLADKQAVNRALLASGASIQEMNCVRKHLSAIKGGRLAVAAYPARVVTLLISDVPGDDPAVIASGPTVADPTTYADARAILAKYGITPPPAVQSHLVSAGDETPKPGDARLARAEIHLIATPQASLMAAAEVAKSVSVAPLVLSDSIEGESREVARVLAGIARQVRQYAQPIPAPCVLLSGGETTVTLRGKGRGGRNVEFLLALALALRGQPQTWAIAGDTDGVDGVEEIAGAIVTPDTLDRAARRGVRAANSLADNDGHGFFEGLGDQVVTGPTLTNVNDFRAVLVESGAAIPSG